MKSREERRGNLKVEREEYKKGVYNGRKTMQEIRVRYYHSGIWGKNVENNNLALERRKREKTFD